MKRYLSMFESVLLFDRIKSEDLLRMLDCLNAQVIPVRRGQMILRQGDPAARLGIVLGGSVHVITGDEQGNHAVITAIHEREVFGEAYACAGAPALPVSVVAAEDSMVMLLEHERVITGCRNGCMAHSLLVTNLMRVIARKNLVLNEKLSIVTRKTTRDKLLGYLLEQRRRAGTPRFAIPFDRQGLADYLGVERSAMSAELSKMKKDGLIDYRKNEFEILHAREEQAEVHHG